MEKPDKKTWPIIVILLSGLVVITWNLDYNSVYHDEALNILMGRQVLAGSHCPGCAQNTGSVMIQPVLAALGDSAGGIYGARAVSVIFGLGLVYVIYAAANVMIPGKNPLAAAILLLFTGNTLYLSKLATYDIVSAFFLGLSFMFILFSGRRGGGKYPGLFLFCGATALLLAAITKYVTAVYIPAFLLFVFLRNRRRDAVLFFFVPVSLYAAAYIYLALYPSADVLLGSITSVREESHLPLSVLSNWTLRWVIMPYLLAIFGLFHHEKGRAMVPLLLLSTPVLILHLATGTEQSVNKNVIFSIIFLSPAAAMGIEHMSGLFSTKIDTTWVRPFFTTAVIAVVIVFGINELRWLEKQYPDMRPVIAFLNDKGFDGMLVTTGSDYGESIYAYSLAARFPRARFIPFTEITKAEARGSPLISADFVITDDYYSKETLNAAVLDYLNDDYKLIKKIKVPLRGEFENVKIFKRR